MGDLGLSAKLESAKFEADRDYKLKLAELNADIAAAGGFEESNLPKESELNAMVANIGGDFLAKHPTMRDQASSLVLAIMKDLHAGNLPYARATGIRTAIKEELRRRMVEAGLDANSSGVSGNSPVAKGKSNKTNAGAPVTTTPNAGANLKSLMAKPKPNP